MLGPDFFLKDSFVRRDIKDFVGSNVFFDKSTFLEDDSFKEEDRFFEGGDWAKKLNWLFDEQVAAGALFGILEAESFWK